MFDTDMFILNILLNNSILHQKKSKMVVSINANLFIPLNGPVPVRSQLSYVERG